MHATLESELRHTTQQKLREGQEGEQGDQCGGYALKRVVGGVYHGNLSNLERLSGWLGQAMLLHPQHLQMSTHAKRADHSLKGAHPLSYNMSAHARHRCLLHMHSLLPATLPRQPEQCCSSPPSVEAPVQAGAWQPRCLACGCPASSGG